jgi:anti-sigma regulatory factor (Ser/Thr protein kinase)
VELRATLSDHPGEVSRARRLVASRLTRWGLADNDSVIVLLVSELVTNALRHGSAPLGLVARNRGDAIRVEVYDAAPGLTPKVHHGGPDITGGRGLWLVDVLASRWGWSGSAREKCVWFEVDLPQLTTASAVRLARASA